MVVERDAMRCGQILGIYFAAALTLALMTLPGRARADDALDRCWAIKMGMSREEVARLLGVDLPPIPEWGGLAVELEKFPCFLRIRDPGVEEIQISDHRFSPPHEAMFADELRRGIAAWGPPDAFDFDRAPLKWGVTWGGGTKDDRFLMIEPDSTIYGDKHNNNRPLVYYINGALISYAMRHF